MVYWVNLASPGFFAAAPGATQCTKCPKGEIQVEMVESSSTNGEQLGFTLWLCQVIAIENGHRNSGFSH